MARSVGTTKGVKARCDRLFSTLVLSRGACQYCGRTKPAVKLETAHLLSRRFIRTRYEPTNAFCACCACHMAWTDNPVRFARFALFEIGSDEYDRLCDLSESRTKMDWVATEARLRELLEENSGA